MKLIGKLFITGDLIAKTGLHIGGSKSSLDIGGVDLNVIKSPKGEPFIPGSSLKGKMRSLLARIEGSVAVNKKELRKEERSQHITDEDIPYIEMLFGSSGDDNERGEPTRLLVRDAPLQIEKSPSLEKGDEMDFAYTDIKWENRIDRRRGVAKDPRQLERVPAGATFSIELVCDIYEEDSTTTYKGNKDNYLSEEAVTRRDQFLWGIHTALQLLGDDYLGGHGSRGYGRVAYENLEVTLKSFNNFEYQLTSIEGDAALETFSNKLKALCTNESNHS